MRKCLSCRGLLVPVLAENEQDEAPPTTERTEGASPTQRGRKSEQSLTLDMLKEVLAQERRKDREHLAQSLQVVKGDIQEVRRGIDNVEGPSRCRTLSPC